MSSDKKTSDSKGGPAARSGQVNEKLIETVKRGTERPPPRVNPPQETRKGVRL
jgi:hypothetical protein